MAADPYRIGGDGIDLSGRVAASVVVVASPAAAAETIIAQVALPFPLRGDEFVSLSGWAALTIGTSGTALTLRIRRTSVAGTLVVSTGALTGGIAAAGLVAQDVEGVDTGTATVYVLTAQVTAGAAISTVSAVKLRALIY